MNTTPDDIKLALWLDDELTGDELVQFESSFGDRAELLAQREEVRKWRASMRSVLPMSEEPPHGEFFNARIARCVREGAAAGSPLQMGRKSEWQRFWMPLAACAGMVLAFFAGQKLTSRTVEIDVAGAPKAIPVEPVVYTPDGDVNAEWFASSEASATVIVLSGVDAIPDTTDFSQTAGIPGETEMNSTAGVELRISAGEGPSGL